MCWLLVLMVRPLYTLALRAIQTNQSVSANLTRIQHGFMAERNILELERTLKELQDTLHEMKQSLQTQEKSPPIVPLK